jgi:hypothetical protein
MSSASSDLGAGFSWADVVSSRAGRFRKLLAGPVLVGRHEVGHRKVVVGHVAGSDRKSSQLARGKRTRGCKWTRANADAQRTGRLADIALSQSLLLLLHALPQILPQRSIGCRSLRPDLGRRPSCHLSTLVGSRKGCIRWVDQGELRLPTAAEPGRTQRPWSRSSRCYNFIWFAGREWG